MENLNHDPYGETIVGEDIIEDITDAKEGDTDLVGGGQGREPYNPPNEFDGWSVFVSALVWGFAGLAVIFAAFGFGRLIVIVLDKVVTI